MENSKNIDEKQLIIAAQEIKLGNKANLEKSIEIIDNVRAQIIEKLIDLQDIALMRCSPPFNKK